MANSPSIKLRGLYTYPNPLGEVPPGSLVTADNVVLDSPGSIQSRRGLDVLSETLGSASSRANKLFNFQNQLLCHYDTTKMAYRNTGVGWSDYSGTYEAIDTSLHKVRSAEAASNFFFTTASGVKKLTAYNSTPTDAGGIKAIDVEAALAGAGSGFFSNNTVLSTTGDISSGSNQLSNLASTTGIAVGQYVSGTGIPAGTTVTAIAGSTVTMSANATATTASLAVKFYEGSQVAYRVVWGIKDANNNLILGTPSPREVIANTGSTSDDVTLTISIPSGVTTSHFYQVYRSPQTVDATTEPNDELQQVYEANPTSGEITAKTLTFTDSITDALRGAYIYTAASQEGILQSNDPPPLARDVALFKDSMFYANTTSKHRLEITLLAVGGASGITAGDTITINGQAYLADSAEDATANPPEFKVYTSGTPAQNIRDTANSLIRVINQASVNSTIYAYYLSGYSDLPGKILLEKRSLGGSSFAVTASAHGSAFDPSLPTSGTTVASEEERYRNAIYISKTGKHEAVPLTNVLFAGSAANEIKRIVALRDSLFIFKDDGIFKVIGQSPSNFYIDLVDDTTKLLAPDTAVNLNNTIYCLTNQGVVSVSDTGVSIVSRDIEGDLLTLFGASLSNVSALSWGVSYQSDRKYLLGIIAAGGDTTPTQIYVYNIFTDSWTRWPLSKTCGIISTADDKLYLGDASSNMVNIERKTFSYLDYLEGTTSVTIVSASGTSVVLSSVSGIQVGDLLYQSSTVRSVVTAIDGGTNTVTVQDSLGTWSAGAATVYSAINCVIQFQPQTGKSPQSAKQFSELELFFKRARFNQATLSFYSDLSQSIDSVPIAGVNNGAWGLFPWGGGSSMIPFGGDLRPIPVRTYVPKNKQRCSQLNIKLTHRVAYGDFLLDGINLKVREVSNRVSR